ncbi:MAG TPA: hypothetical protein VGC42_06585, partial [Kofleriaceae bacterium]
MTDAELLASAHAARPAGWVADAAFIAHARAHAEAHARACDPGDAGELHAADLYLALACAHGVPAALEA